MRVPSAPALLVLLAACGGGGAAPLTGSDPGGGGSPAPGAPGPGTPATPGPPAPSTATIEGVEDAFRPADVTIAAGGSVTWRMIDEEHDVTWTGVAPAGGSIGKLDRGATATRTFATPGSYAYSCARHRNRHGGTVTVTGGSTTAPDTTPPSGSATVETPGETFSPASVTVIAGGTVTWRFTGVSRHDVTFTGERPPGGDVPATDVGGTAQRQFPAAGTYAYRCTRHAGMTGQVVVQP
jgi:plastocyanin